MTFDDLKAFLRQSLKVRVLDESTGSMFGGDVPGETVKRVELALVDPDTGVVDVLSSERVEL